MNERVHDACAHAPSCATREALICHGFQSIRVGMPKVHAQAPSSLKPATNVRCFLAADSAPDRILDTVHKRRCAVRLAAGPADLPACCAAAEVKRLIAPQASTGPPLTRGCDLLRAPHACLCLPAWLPCRNRAGCGFTAVLGASGRAMSVKVHMDVVTTTTNTSKEPTKPSFKQMYPKPVMMMRLPPALIRRKILSNTYKTLKLTDEAVAALPEGIRTGTLEARKLVGRRPTAFSIPWSTRTIKEAARWQPRPTDIIIATAPKTGTTWLQHMLHTIKTDGDTNFDDVYEVAPWIDGAWEMGQDLNADQAAPQYPRIFKSHALLSKLHEGCKCACVALPNAG